MMPWRGEGGGVVWNIYLSSKCEIEEIGKSTNNKAVRCQTAGDCTKPTLVLIWLASVKNAVANLVFCWVDFSLLLTSI